ncbi:MAG: MBL fold metallo-hydrolase [Stomatobaculum sp.]|nr:MBL fold metallo-hydrolase [Stomatobaculum sp.]
MQVRVLGARGSMTISNRKMWEFGGATTAYLMEAEGEVLFIDAGSGIMNVPGDLVPKDRIRLFISHTHLDHIMGMPFFLSDCCMGKILEVYGHTREGETVEQQIAHLFSNPLWPVGLRDYSGITYRFHELERMEKVIEEGPFRITWMESNHPGGCVIYRVDAGGKSVVVATDFEHTDGFEGRLTHFAKNTDLLLYDGQYREADYPKYKGFGHSTEEAGLRIFRNSGAKRLLIIHHAPYETDETLDFREKMLQSQEANTGFAREGQILVL